MLGRSLATLGGLDSCGRVAGLRFDAGSGTESRKPSTCNDNERNEQFDPCRFNPVVDVLKGGGIADRALFSESVRSESALLLAGARIEG